MTFATAKRGVQALLLVGTPLVLSAWLLFPQTRPSVPRLFKGHTHVIGGPLRDGYYGPKYLVYDRHFHLYTDPDGDGYYDPRTGRELDDDDPRFNAGRMAQEIKAEHDRIMREDPKQFDPPHYK